MSKIHFSPAKKTENDKEGKLKNSSSTRELGFEYICFYLFSSSVKRAISFIACCSALFFTSSSYFRYQ